MQKKLAAFDFDHTIVEENSDVVAINLIDSSLIPTATKQLYRKDGWTAYMQSIFQVLHKNGVNQTVITNSIRSMRAVDGICELLRDLKDTLGYDVIIISDSNSYFINEWLQEKNLQNYILKVFTNPASFEDGILKMRMFHFQDHCKLSTKNLCKGQILDDFIHDRENDGVVYDKILYAGDGANDFCPILRLKNNDLACVREKFKCAELVRNAMDAKTSGNGEKKHFVKASVCFWNSGFDILQSLKTC